MKKSRPVIETRNGTPTEEGAGVRLRRVFGFTAPETFDPFLLFDDFRSDTPAEYVAGFPWHPHRGIETITYVTAGTVEHGDSLGNKGAIGTGDVQWMTAGGGIVHQEMPKGDARGRMHGFQLWANLPAREKMGEPRYRGILAAEIPTVRFGDDAIARVISGTMLGVRGPVTEVAVDPLYLDVELGQGAEVRIPVPETHNAFAYATGGSGTFGDAGRVFADRELARFGAGDHVVAQAGEAGFRFLLAAGVPLREPIAWRGPIVMNTQAQLDEAFREYRAGTFLKHAKGTPSGAGAPKRP